MPSFGSLQQTLTEDISLVTSKLPSHSTETLSLPYQLLHRDHKSSLNQELQLQQLQYNKLLEERGIYQSEKLSLPSYTTLTGNVQQRTLFRAASIYPYQDLTLNPLQPPSIYFH